MFKFFLLSVFIFIISFDNAFARSVRVKGYYRKNGTYVKPHHRSSPDSTTKNNWITKGNYNPYNGKKGTKEPEHNNNYNTQSFKRYESDQNKSE